MPRSPPQKASSIAATLLVQRCTATTSLRRARQLHAYLLTTQRSPNVTESFLHNNILFMYARCGSFEDAHQVFDKMPQRKVVSFNALISAYSRSRHHAHSAFPLLDRMRHELFSYNELTATSILQASAVIGDLAVGSSLHAWSLKLGFLDNVHVQTSLLGMYSKCGDVNCAEKVFIHMIDKDGVAWNSIISAYAKNGRFLKGLQAFGKMLRNGVQASSVTYSLLLNACAKFEDYDRGKLVHAQALLQGIYADLPLQNALLDMYCSCRNTDAAFAVFARINNPDLVSWNSMMGGYSESGDGEKLMNMFVQLLRESPFKPDEYTFLAVVSGTVGFPARACGEPVHALIEKTGVSGNVYVAGALVSMYFRNDDSLSSQKIFSLCADKDSVLWTDMIAGHVKIGECEDALKFFHGMYLEGCDLDSFALSSALSACADLATLRQGEMIHCLAIKTGSESEDCVCNGLIDMYAKNGELRAAAQMFSCLPNGDLMCWNSMLTAFGHHGMAKEAFQIFYQMLKRWHLPDQVTFLSLLSACSHCGMVDVCRYVWNLMDEHSLQPGRKHYSCVIGLLSRAGLWEEAEEMINRSPFREDYVESWRMILSSCVRRGNLQVGIYAAEKILSVCVDDCAANILIAKLYAASGRWNDVKETWRRMRHLMVEKDPGLSWIEIQNNVHVFGSGDQSGEIKDVLGKMIMAEEIEAF
ncbi:pentatricopeptide repeat-containing protein At3g50420 [Andrographis paniculata]|uniref:pentatricopeptide repeat-containing protein At3g50420 n=1 Tax=Andrographis paniculata TaxID=175694 RepID=UPI0021E72DC7|nr:pentatricopeptide repeat-containing protein At3g50420 [Andrographis paniculata]